jgi:hypothetical protein
MHATFTFVSYEAVTKHPNSTQMVISAFSGPKYLKNTYNISENTVAKQEINNHIFPSFHIFRTFSSICAIQINLCCLILLSNE